MLETDRSQRAVDLGGSKLFTPGPGAVAGPAADWLRYGAHEPTDGQLCLVDRPGDWQAPMLMVYRAGGDCSQGQPVFSITGGVSMRARTYLWWMPCPARRAASSQQLDAGRGHIRAEVIARELSLLLDSPVGVTAVPVTVQRGYLCFEVATQFRPAPYTLEIHENACRSSLGGLVELCLKPIAKMIRDQPTVAVLVTGR